MKIFIFQAYAPLQHVFCVAQTNPSKNTNSTERTKFLLIDFWLQVWNDYQLQWDEADYGGIAVLRLPPDKVWKPDIVLFNK